MSSLSALPPPLFTDPRTFASLWEKDNARRLRWLALALVVIGLLWRCTRYFLCFPIWGDEALLLLNYVHRDFSDLLGPIDNGQVAPLLYHVAAMTSLQLLGSGELAVRLPSFVACLASLVLFWRLARLTLSPLARTLAVGILAVSIWPATMGSLTKPYAFDLLASLALLLPAVTWLRRPDRLLPLVMLVVIVPVAILGSYPAVFVAGGVGVALLPVVVRQRRPAVAALFVCFGLLLASTFLGHYWFVARAHLASGTQGTNTATWMSTYWKAGFPPVEPMALLQWIVLANTGQMAAYPLGSANGGSALTILLGIIGLIVLWRRGQRQLILLMGVVFALGLVAALLHKYPYGTSCRLAQHVAPFYCLLAGLGTAVLLEQTIGVMRRWGATLVITGFLAAIGIGGMVRDFLHPYRDDESRKARLVVEALTVRSGDEPIVVLPTETDMAIFQWQLSQHGDHVVWHDEIDWDHLARATSSLWVIRVAPPEDERLWVAQRLASAGRTWRCVERTQTVVLPDHVRKPLKFCRIYHWVCADD